MVETRKTRKRPTNRLENQTNDTSEETVEKKDNKKFTVRFVRRSHQALTSVQFVTSLFMIFVEVTVKTVEVSD